MAEFGNDLRNGADVIFPSSWQGDLSAHTAQISEQANQAWSNLQNGSNVLVENKTLPDIQITGSDITFKNPAAAQATIPGANYDLGQGKDAEALKPGDLHTAQLHKGTETMTQTANGETISRTSDGRVSEIIFSDGEKNTYKYDSQGHVTQASYSHNDRAWSVVRQQNGTYQEIDGNGKPLKGKYDSLSVDSAGNETKVSGKLSTTYNIDGSKVVSEKDANGFPRPLHVRDANGNQRDYTYNSAGQIAHLNYTDGHNGYNDAWVRKGDGTYENYKELKDGNYEDTGRNLPIVAAYADGTYTETDDQDNVQVYRTDGTIKPA